MIPKIEPHKIEKCAACGALNIEGFVVCSGFGAFSDALCMRCISEGREVYQQVVNYIADAGRWPDDINEDYQEEVRRQLRLHNKTEEEFKADVDTAIALMDVFIGENIKCSYENYAGGDF
jgi:hypothetical protein